MIIFHSIRFQNLWYNWIVQFGVALLRAAYAVSATLPP